MAKPRSRNVRRKTTAVRKNAYARSQVRHHHHRRYGGVALHRKATPRKATPPSKVRRVKYVVAKKKAPSGSGLPPISSSTYLSMF